MLVSAAAAWGASSKPSEPMTTRTRNHGSESAQAWGSTTLKETGSGSDTMCHSDEAPRVTPQTKASSGCSESNTNDEKNTVEGGLSGRIGGGDSDHDGDVDIGVENEGRGSNSGGSDSGGGGSNCDRGVHYARDSGSGSGDDGVGGSNQRQTVRFDQQSQDNGRGGAPSTKLAVSSNKGEGDVHPSNQLQIGRLMQQWRDGKHDGDGSHGANSNASIRNSVDTSWVAVLPRSKGAVAVPVVPVYWYPHTTPSVLAEPPGN